jgi:pimeloyl-ACP methyl ester carboxylesterase
MHKKISLAGGRSLIAGFSKASSKHKNWLVFLPESGAEFQGGGRQELKRLLGGKLAAQFHYLVINKNGVSPDGVKAQAFEMSFRRQRRVQDALSTMKQLIPPDHHIILVGYSEGAYLSPQVARGDSRVRGVVMVGGGTRGWLKEELSNAGPLEKREFSRMIKDIHAHPRSLKKWNGFSYATWYSYREDKTLEAVTKLKVPVLAILGKRDRTINFKATWSDLKKRATQQDLRLRVFSNCGHSFVNHWSDAWNEIRKFIVDQKLNEK